MTAGGVRIWFKKRADLKKSEHLENQEEDKNL